LEKNPSGCSFEYYGQGKLEITLAKDLKMKGGVLWYFIYENKEKRVKGEMKGHRFA